MNSEFILCSESSFILSFGSTIDPLVSQEVQKAYQTLKKANVEGIYEIIPSYASLFISFDVIRYSAEEAFFCVNQVIKEAKDLDEREQRIITIPTYYGTEVGLDLELLAEEKGLSVEAIIGLHVKEIYSVYAIGFAPGFAYMGEIDTALATARLSNPRKMVPKGSVSIADRQTAVYPMKSPGGWKILGRTPTAMFDVTYEGLSLLHVGDKVRFKPISKEEFLQLGGEL